MIPVTIVPVDLAYWDTTLSEHSKRKGWRYGHLAVRRLPSGSRQLEALLLNPSAGAVEVLSACIPDGVATFPSAANAIPAIHRAERAIGDLWGIRAAGHPRWKPLILHEAWGPDEFPLGLPQDGPLSPREPKFMVVGGRGIHEIPVGPIHAGIIEPGHFRFSCHGEVIAYLEIHLGFVHRGVEKRLAEVPWRHARHIAESAGSDTALAHALAHAEVIESLLQIQVPPRAAILRTIALELERVAVHLSDLAALASDTGFAIGAASLGRARFDAIGLVTAFSGTRFMRGFVCPGGVAWEIPESRVASLQRGLAALKPAIEDSCELMFGNPGVQERLEGIGILQPSLATEFGISGPAARASGSKYDSRRSFQHGVFPARQLDVAQEQAGDVQARAMVRRKEVMASLQLIEELCAELSPGEFRVAMPATLPPDKVGVGIVESWRGELIHWITTDCAGQIARYTIRDASFQNWTGLAIAVRNNLVMDFPLINKSFNLSYSGHDL